MARGALFKAGVDGSSGTMRSALCGGPDGGSSMIPTEADVRIQPSILENSQPIHFRSLSDPGPDLSLKRGRDRTGQVTRAASRKRIDALFHLDYGIEGTPRQPQSWRELRDATRGHRGEDSERPQRQRRALPPEGDPPDADAERRPDGRRNETIHANADPRFAQRKEHMS